MSQNTNSTGPWKLINKVISPRENAKAFSVFDNVANVARNSWILAKSIVGTTVDFPLGIIEAGIAAPNNIVGYATELVDKGPVQIINSIRARMNTVLNQPVGGGAPRVAMAA